MKLVHVLLFLLAGSLLACQQEPEGPLSHIKNRDVKIRLQKAIDSAGGWENWTQLDTLRFDKYFALYDSTGATEQEVLQQHSYTLQPEIAVKISWEADSMQQQIVAKQGRWERIKGGAIDTSANQQALENTVRAATFVMGLPWKLTDPGVVLSYEGQDTLEDGRAVEVLKAVYLPGEIDTHTTPDTWWHYYDAESYEFVAYLVQHADHFSYVENRSSLKAGGLRFPKDRRSYRVTPDRRKLYLRAVYAYDNYLTSPL